LSGISCFDIRILRDWSACHTPVILWHHHLLGRSIRSSAQSHFAAHPITPSRGCFRRETAMSMSKFTPKLAALLALLCAAAFLAPLRALAQDQDGPPDGDDPPTRVARISHTDGAVSFNPAGTDDWVSAVINRPMTTGDKLWADNGARAELHIGSASLRIGSTTGFSFLNLADTVSQIHVTAGTLRA